MRYLQSRFSKESHTPGCLYHPRKTKKDQKLNEHSAKEVRRKAKIPLNI